MLGKGVAVVSAGRCGATVGAVVALLLCHGCASDDRPIADRVIHFQTALAQGDAAAACADLADEAREALEDQEKKSCEKAITDQGLPGGRATPEVNRYGSMAQAHGNGDVLFLSRFDAGWRVVAAGCTDTRDDKPYECTVEVD